MDSVGGMSNGSRRGAHPPAGEVPLTVLSPIVRSLRSGECPQELFDVIDRATNRFETPVV